MKLQTRDIINAPVDVVFKQVRDGLSDLVPYLLNVEKIKVEERREEGQKVHLVTHWYAKADIPGVAKKFIGPDIMSWRDIAIWHSDEKYVEFRLESFIAKNLFEVKGRNSMRELGANQTEMRIDCDLEIYPERLPGVPKFLASTVKGPVEELIKKMLQPNLASLAEGLNKYFASKK